MCARLMGPNRSADSSLAADFATVAFGNDLRSKSLTEFLGAPIYWYSVQERLDDVRPSSCASKFVVSGERSTRETLDYQH